MCGDSDLYEPVMSSGVDSDESERGVELSGFSDMRLALGGRLNTTRVPTLHHLAPHVLGNGMQLSPAPLAALSPHSDSGRLSSDFSKLESLVFIGN